jgi:hypothetical protein
MATDFRKLGARSDVNQHGAHAVVGTAFGKNKIGRVEPGQSIFASWVGNLRRPRRLPAAATPEAEAEAAAAATAAAATPAPATSAPATTATATPRHLLQGAAIVFLVEQMECRQADVRDFLFTQRDRLRRREVEFRGRADTLCPLNSDVNLFR